MQYVIRFTMEIEGGLGDKAFWFESMDVERETISRVLTIDEATRMPRKEAITLKNKLQSLMTDKVAVRVEGVEEDSERESEIITP